MRLLADNILIKPRFKGTSDIIITESSTELDTVADVLLVGPLVKEVSVADVIAWSGRSGTPFTYNEEDCIIIKEYDVYGVK